MEDAQHKQPTPADILHRKLRALARDGYYLSSVENGNLHEVQLMATLWKIAVAAGVDANMVELAGSNHPLAERDRDFKPSGYWFKARPYLQVDGELIGLCLSQRAGQSNRLVVSRHSKQGGARKAMGSPAHFKWEVINEECEPEVLSDFELPEMQVDLAAAALSMKAPSVQTRKSGPRL